MGLVYLARDPILQRLVAIKVLSPHLSSDETVIARFINEARIAASLQHPNIVTVYEAGQDGNFVFMAMEYVEGQDLASLIRQKGKLHPDEAIAILKAVASALDYAHQKGVIHRDVKPSNVLISNDGVVKLMDFGIARVVGGERHTKTGVLVGTPEYMAPELWEGKDADKMADLYSLGVMAYEMLTGEVPFTGDTPIAVGYKHVHGEVSRTGLGEIVDEVLKVAMAKEKEKRFQSGMAMVMALEKALMEREISLSQSKKGFASIDRQKPEEVVGNFREALLTPSNGVESEKRPIARREVSPIVAIFACVTTVLVVVLSYWMFYEQPWKRRSPSSHSPVHSQRFKPKISFGSSAETLTKPEHEHDLPSISIEEHFERAYQDAIKEAQKSSWALRMIAVALAEAGQFDRAIQTLNLALQNVRTGEDAVNRSVDLSGIAISLAKAGQFDRAIQVAQKFDYAWDCWHALSEISKMLAEAGQFDRAIQIALKIWDPEVRSLALGKIAEELAKAGQSNRANQIFNLAIQIAQKSGCSSALGKIAKVLIKVGQIDKANQIFNLAIQTAQEIEDEFDRFVELKDIARALAEVGQIDRALQITQKIEDTAERSAMLREIAEVLAQARQFNQALQIAQKIENEEDRSGAFKGIAEALAKVGQFDRAIQIAQKIKNAMDHSLALKEISVALTQAGHFNRANQTFNLAIQEAQKIENAYWRSWALTDIAEALAKAGQIDRVLQIAQKIRDAKEFSGALCNIAKALAESGQLDRAIEVAEKIEEPIERFKAFAAIMAAKREAEKRKNEKHQEAK